MYFKLYLYVFIYSFTILKIVNGKQSVRKCCPENYFIKSAKTIDRICVSQNDSEIPVEAWVPPNSTNADLPLITGFPSIPSEDRDCGIFKNENYILQSNGQLYINSSKKEYSSEFYCMDNSVNGKLFRNTNSYEIIYCIQIETMQITQ